MAIDYSKAYTKLPRSRLKSNMDGEDSIISYDKNRAAALVAGPYEKPKPKNTTVIYKTPAPKAKDIAPQHKAAERLDARKIAPKSSVVSANLRKEDYSKGSTQPAAYQGQEGDKPKKRGAVTSYVKDGYTYMKNAQGNFQNFKAGPVPTVKKKDSR